MDDVQTERLAEKGVFIVFDGIDGAGKSTQLARFCDRFREAGRSVVASREPTDGPWGRRIRDSATTGRLSPEDELEAFIQDRREHVSTRIGPSVNDGNIVIVDRYYYSTVAYQGLRGADADWLLHQMQAEFPRPDLTIFFDLPVPEALRRIAEHRGEQPNEFEQEASLLKIRQLFQTMASVCPEVRTIDCVADVDSVTRQIAAVMLKSPLVGNPNGENRKGDPLCSMLQKIAAG